MSATFATQMAKRQREWARRTRDWLFGLLGAKCAKCGSTEDLEFDVIIPIGDVDKDGKAVHQRKYEWSQRMTFYVRQYNQNNLQVLCSKCNSRKKNNLELHSDNETTPF